MEELLRHNLLAGHAMAASGSIAIASSLTHPLDTLKSLLQVGAGARKQANLPQLYHRVQSISGISGLYSGLGWSIIGRNLGIAARFGTYELMTAFYTDGREDNYISTTEALLAGFTAGAVEAVLNTPFELLKLRGQLTSAYLKEVNIGKLGEIQTTKPKFIKGYNPNVRTWTSTVELLSALPKTSPRWADSLKESPWMLTGSGRPPLASEVKNPTSVLKLEGFGAMWRGLRPGIARDSLFGGIFFSTWQFLHSSLLDWKAVNMDPPPRLMEEIGPVPPLATSLAAGVSGSVAGLASHCFDTAATRSQCIVTPKYIAMERKALRWKDPGTWVERKVGIFPGDRGFLFRGIGLRIACSGFASFGIVGCYLMAVKHIL